MRLQIQEAVDTFNFNSKGKKRLSMSLLAQVVIKRQGRDKKEVSVQRKRQIISDWNTGSGRFPMASEVEQKKIAEITGVTLEFLKGEN